MTNGLRVRVHFLPELVPAEELAGSCVAVIDVLRATTTAIAALAAGAREVLPCLTIDDARRRYAELPAGTALLGGERGGRAIDGFNLGNSPLEYTADVVAGKSIVLTTTNGTKALLYCRAAADIALAAFVNVAAAGSHLLEAARHHDGRIDLVCSGTDGRITREDVLLAGALAYHVAESGACQFDDSADIARDVWRAMVASIEGGDAEERLAGALAASRGGRNLCELGMQRDIAFSARLGAFNLVPRFFLKSQSISAAARG